MKVGTPINESASTVLSAAAPMNVSQTTLSVGAIVSVIRLSACPDGLPTFLLPIAKKEIQAITNTANIVLTRNDFEKTFFFMVF